mmetsp:Transcript_12861/g.19275  ORF Transcript_12861/g.19275 Transcript_12861/m.19275 type:complete len:156 (+) Transcript_12861:131-598(+)
MDIRDILIKDRSNFNIVVTIKASTLLSSFLAWAGWLCGCHAALRNESNSIEAGGGFALILVSNILIAISFSLELFRACKPAGAIKNKATMGQSTREMLPPTAAITQNASSRISKTDDLASMREAKIAVARESNFKSSTASLYNINASQSQGALVV